MLSHIISYTSPLGNYIVVAMKAPYIPKWTKSHIELIKLLKTNIIVSKTFPGAKRGWNLGRQPSHLPLHELVTLVKVHGNPEPISSSIK